MTKEGVFRRNMHLIRQRKENMSDYSNSHSKNNSYSEHWKTIFENFYDDAERMLFDETTVHKTINSNDDSIEIFDILTLTNFRSFDLEIDEQLLNLEIIGLKKGKCAYDNDPPVLKFIHGSTNYDVVSAIDFEYLLAFHSDTEEIIQKSLEQFDITHSYYKKQFSALRESFWELTKDQEKLIESGGDGYRDVFEDELRNKSDQLWNSTEDAVNNFVQLFIESFLSYKDSKILDLSIVDGVRCYIWNDFEESYLNEYFTDVFVREIMMKKFDIHQILNYTGK